MPGGSSRIHGVANGATLRPKSPILAACVLVLACLGACRAPRPDPTSGPPGARSPLPPPLYADELLAPSRDPGPEGRRLEMRRLNEWLAESSAATRDAERTSAWLRLAVLNARNGEPEEAEACLVAATSAPAHPRAEGLAWLLRARIHSDAGRRSEAIAALDKAERYATDWGTRRHIADTRSRLGPSSPPKVATAPAKEPTIDAKLRFVRRSQWGSRKADSSNMDPMRPPKLITVHHTAMPPPSSTSEAAAQVRQIQRNQMTQSGWGDIGYHFLIDRRGVVFEGRELRYQGAHAGDNVTNRGNIGICLLGNFQPGTGEPSQEPTRAQVVSLESLVATLCARYAISSGRVRTHREVHPKGPGATLCPGDNLVAVVRRMRSRLAHVRGTN